MGASIGWLIGALITVGKMNNFIVTLAMLLILRGPMLGFTEGQTVFSGKSPAGRDLLPAGPRRARRRSPGSARCRSRSSSCSLSSSSAYVVLKHRRFGRELYAIGGNRAAAIASGIDADKRVRQVYMISGMLAAFGGWMLAGPRRLDPGQSRRGLHLHGLRGGGDRRRQPAGRARHDARRARRRAAALDHRPRPQPDAGLGVLDRSRSRA